MTVSNLSLLQVRGTSRPNYPEGESRLGCNNSGEQLLAYVLPERTALVALGKSFGAAIPTGSAFTFVTAWPTTSRSELVLQNGEVSGGRSYIIDRVWMDNITTAAAAQPFSLLGQVVPAGLNVTLVADNTAVIRHNLLAKSTTIDSAAKLCLADTTWAVNDQWFMLGNGYISPMTTNRHGSCEAHVFGRYIIPPRGAFCMAGLAGSAAGTAIIGVEWHEVQLVIG
jgi:hypothetical protein